MYTIKRVSVDEIAISSDISYSTVFTTKEWITFLQKSINGEPVVLSLNTDGRIVAYFVGMIISKIGIKILGSPFEGWLTPDMGFVVVDDNISYVDAIEDVSKYAFKKLKCLYFQLIDKKISIDTLNNRLYYEKSNLLKLDLTGTVDEILEDFAKNGRRDVRASYRKGTEFKKVPFNKEFVEIYYDQLIEVFEKQNLKPFYGIQKLYDLVNAFKGNETNVLALAAFYEEKCIATNFSFGTGEWAYYIGAASYREYQKYLPNEGLFWEFVKYWSKRGIKYLDLVGYRSYKLKYNPKIEEVPVVMIARFSLLLQCKKLAKQIIIHFRKIKGIFAVKKHGDGVKTD